MGLEEFSETLLIIFTYGHYDLSDLSDTATATFLWHLLFYAVAWWATYQFLRLVVEFGTRSIRIR